MKNKISMDVAMAGQFQEFIDRAGIEIDVVTDGRCDLAIVQCDDRRESDLRIIYSGGWVACETARGYAEELGISKKQMGLVLDHLNVKVRHCSLGCFE